MKDKSGKKDHLERFVRDNRERFDQYEPSAQLWERIDRALPADVPSPNEKKKGWMLPLAGNWLRIAAGLVLALGLGMLLYLHEGDASDPTAQQQPSYDQEMSQYAQLIDQKRDEILKLTNHNPELRKAFSSDLQALEANYQSLKQDLGNAPNQEAMLQAMIQNLQWQIDLLNQQLDILQRFNNSTDENNKTDDHPAVI
ncbi:hypothetical protein CLV98_101123 [Dyadobacter jejuensis]|uniref:Anti-sigma-K factor rskA n=1 Tax=Dyadobacter jejuensis TaxID=1082580 RepID=A0A316AR01_9BACT|nr:hypothetical protein [Dyadobacter jejuensis]PWJ59948.1 hypothetical protein CLV98_101123 [Dyadobacter jejuensis]